METKQRKPRTVSTLTAFGKFCSKLRIDLDISVPDWAKALDTNAQTVKSYEYGRKELDVPFLIKLGELISEKSPKSLTEFNNQFVIPTGVVFINGLTDEQRELVIGVVNGTISITPISDENASCEIETV